MRMAAGGNIGIDANGHSRDSGGEASAASGFFEQEFQFSEGFDVELENAGRSGTPGAIVKSSANFFPGFADTGKDNALAGHSDVAEVLEFPTGDDVEAAAEIREALENGKIAVGLY